jgi:catechol 2,3-dioxygenase-like lactoylglutathione lyase family enzyme
MGFHHVAVATRDLRATHRFYTEATGFLLAKVVAAPTPEAGWARHVFYDTGNGELLAVWDIHDATLPDFDPAISTGLGLPIWANHIAFAASDLDDLHDRRQRWLDHHFDVAEIDHGWCTSIYTTDPNGILVEFCVTTAALGAADRADAEQLLEAVEPALEPAPEPQFFIAAQAAGAAAND